MAENKFRLRIVTPERIFYDDMAEMVIVRSTEGELGILKGHAPLTTILSYGKLKIMTDDSEKYCACLGGFMEVSRDSVNILTDAAEWPEEIDVERAMASKERAESIKNTPDMDVERAELAIRRALVRIEVGGYKVKQK